MINKFQQGGILAQIQQLPKDQQQQLMQAFSQWAQQKGIDIQAIQQDPKQLEQALGMFMEEMQAQKTQSAKHGAKLNYLKSLKHQCAEDEEVVYFKKGGSVDCGCQKKKMETGGPVKKGNTVAKFKNDYSSKRVKDSEEAYFSGTADHERYKPLKQELPKKKVQTSGTVKKEVNKYKKLDNKLPEKKACGDKIKKHEQGAKINPIIAKFKATRQ